jgi:hypothetical protein
MDRTATAGSGCAQWSFGQTADDDVSMPLTDRAPLTSEQRAVLIEERTALSDLRELLARQRADDADIQHIRQAERDLDELFLLVVVGEFNAGKSAFVNALIGAPILSEGSRRRPRLSLA